MQHALAHLRTRWPLRGLFLVVLALLCLCSSGCVRRRMTIRSHPPGAQVFVDDREIGTTPCSTSYVYYGKRNVMLVKDGYKTERLVHQFTVPWWEYVPLDFANENLNPYEVRDERTINVTLSPEENVPPEVLLDRANNMRGGARLGLITPLPDVKPGTVLPKIGVPGQGLPGGEPIPYNTLPTPNNGPNSAPNIPFVPSSGALGPPASIIPPAGAPPLGAPPGGTPTFGPPPTAPPAGSLPSGAVPPPGPPAFFPSRAFQ